MGRPRHAGRRAVLAALLGALLVAACGDRRSALPTPSPLSPSPPPIFQPGTYYLGISGGSWGVDGGVCLCIGNCPSSMRVPVDVRRVDDGFAVRAVYGTLELVLGVNGQTVGGTLYGQGREQAEGPSGISVPAADGASLKGTITSQWDMGGPVVSGSVALNDATGHGSCSPANWMLSRR
ncbi:MAG TPA: hypothetical protein VK911_15310 [Vicinamibacterales bacterium]|nr:hypothetical protein [Vicinamibacterales bacterium]